MQPGDRFGQAFVLSGQSSEPRRPRETALDHPAPGQQLEPPFGIEKHDHVEGDPALRRRGGGHLAGRALIDIGQDDVVPGGVLDGGARMPTWARSWASAGVTWRATTSPSVSIARWTLLPLLRLALPEPARCPLSSVDWLARLSRIAAGGASARSCSQRSGPCRSSTMASKPTVAIQRCVC